VVAIGGSDDHKAGVDLGGFDSPIGNPTTLVFSTELSVEGILEGIRTGRTVIKLGGTGDPMLELWPGPDHALEGDTVTADVATVVATVHGAVGQRVRLVQDGEPLGELEIDADPFEAEWTLEAPAEGETRVRAEVLVDGQRRVITSHLWIQPDPATGGTDTGDPDDSGDSGGPPSTTSGPDAGTTGDTGAPTSSGASDDTTDAGCGCRGPTVPPPPAALLLLLCGIHRGRRRAASLDAIEASRPRDS
jgi:hypothetical protein